MSTLYIALDSKVLAVASINEVVKDWTAYIGAVPGENHDKEWKEVLDRGTKLDRKLAELIFEGYFESFWKDLRWRD